MRVEIITKCNFYKARSRIPSISRMKHFVVRLTFRLSQYRHWGEHSGYECNSNVNSCNFAISFPMSGNSRKAQSYAEHKEAAVFL